MNRRRALATFGSAASFALAGCTASPTSPEGITVETVLEGLSSPWGLAFLPTDSSARLLVTEQPGTLRRIDVTDGTDEEIGGVPAVHHAGQGGLLDIAVGPAYPEEPWLYLTYATANDDGESTTALARGQLEPGASTLEAVEELHTATPFVASDAHYGSRVVIGDDDMVYLTVGDRQFSDFGPDHVSQDRSTELGTTLRLEPDGSVPADNPFLEESDVEEPIFSYGHRNAQGMTVHPETGEIWQSEHGEEDGDEINVLEVGANYGWPVAHYGCEYGTTDPVGDQPDEREEVTDPVYYWGCGSGGFPPAGMTFYDNDTISEWEGDLFVGNLAGEYLGRFRVDGTDVEEADPLFEGRGWRIRDVAVDPETGYLYVAVDDDSAPLVRLTPD